MVYTFFILRCISTPKIKTVSYKLVKYKIYLYFFNVEYLQTFQKKVGKQPLFEICNKTIVILCTLVKSRLQNVFTKYRLEILITSRVIIFFFLMTDKSDNQAFWKYIYQHISLCFDELNNFSKLRHLKHCTIFHFVQLITNMFFLFFLLE